MLGDDHALVAEIYDGAFRCVLLDDRATPADDAECARLREASKLWFDTLPNGDPNR